MKLNRKIVAYKIVRSLTAEMLEVQVNEFISDWHVYEGLIVRENWLHQVMVKYEDDLAE